VKRRSQMQDQATAYHEAGHAVMAFKLGITFGRRGVSIDADERSEGRFWHSGRIGGDPTVQMTDRMYCNIERQVMVCLAGINSQRRYRKSSVRRYHANSDYEQAIDLLFHAAGTTEEVNLWHKLLLCRVKSVVESPMWWFVIGELASALLQKRRLSRREAEEVIRGAMLRFDPRAICLSA
jgi:hypothetical protein